MDLWKRVELSGSGEPGIYLNNDKDWGTNPCCEIALRPFQFCNLCEVNASDIESQEDLNERVKHASFIGTLQAGYTDFHYLRDSMERYDREGRPYRCVNDRNRECRCAAVGYEGRCKYSKKREYKDS